MILKKKGGGGSGKVFVVIPGEELVHYIVAFTIVDIVIQGGLNYVIRFVTE